MQSCHALPIEIEEALARGALVVTANQRSARNLRYEFDARQRSAGARFWEPPEILAWQSWLPQLWYRLLLDGSALEMLLNASQEHALWRAIVGKETEMRSLRPLDALAETASRAWSLLHSYQAHNRLREYPGNSDNRVFAGWSAAFHNGCRRLGYLTEAQLAERLLQAVADGKLSLPSEILLVGFDDFTPAQAALLDAIRNSGIDVKETQAGTSTGELHLVDSPSEGEEVAACARWIRSHLASDPQARVGVIVPAIESCRAAIDRTFRQVLAPELNEIDAAVGAGPFEFSLGVPLASTPLATTALDLLRWTTEALPVSRVSALLLSSCFAMEDPRGTESQARAEFDAFVVRQKSLLKPQISINELCNLMARQKSAEVPQLARRLESMRQTLRNPEFTGQQRTHADWATTMQKYLDAAGWAVPAQLDSIEFQTRSKWEDALDELAMLDFDGTRVDFASALKSLKRIAANTLFAPETRHAPVQIMGPLEAAGSTFDAIWFLRANDLEWPANSSTNPLLPWRLQRDMNMPGANPARDMQLGRRITERISVSAPHLVFSYARESKSGHQRPSTALSNLSMACSTGEEIAPILPEPERVALELVMTEPRIPIPPADVVHGGASILELQAACGFRAFAEKRLFASSLDSSSLGLDPGERGSLVHDILDKFWEQTATQAALKRMSKAERKAVLAQSIDRSLSDRVRNVEPGWSSEYISMERQRLLNLLLPWLDYEAGRRGPFTVKAREKKLTNVRIDPLLLEIRVDRVDELEARDGEQPRTVILDYKTGRANPSDWLGDRPAAPQLPLYAVAANEPNLAAVAFASVRTGNEMGLNGLEQEKGILPKSRKLKAESLAAQVAEWKEVLSALANDFYAGRATVDPKQYPKTCEYCEQRLLCRLDVTALGAEVVEENDDSGGLEEDLG